MHWINQTWQKWTLKETFKDQHNGGILLNIEMKVSAVAKRLMCFLDNITNYVILSSSIMLIGGCLIYSSAICQLLVKGKGFVLFIHILHSNFPEVWGLELATLQS